MSSSSENFACGLEDRVVLLICLADAIVAHVLAIEGYTSQDSYLIGNGVLRSGIQNHSTTRQLIIGSKLKKLRQTLWSHQVKTANSIFVAREGGIWDGDRHVAGKVRLMSHKHSTDANSTST